MSKYNTNKNKYLAKSERASVPKITKKQKGSITIEAAFAIPLFLFAALCLIWMIEIQSIKIGVKQAAYSAAKSAAEDTAVIPVLNTIKLKSDIIRLLGKERIERSIIVDGSEGISCLQGVHHVAQISMYLYFPLKSAIERSCPLVSGYIKLGANSPGCKIEIGRSSKCRIR